MRIVNTKMTMSQHHTIPLVAVDGTTVVPKCEHIHMSRACMFRRRFFMPLRTIVGVEHHVFWVGHPLSRACGGKDIKSSILHYVISP